MSSNDHCLLGRQCHHCPLLLYRPLFISMMLLPKANDAGRMEILSADSERISFCGEFSQQLYATRIAAFFSASFRSC